MNRLNIMRMFELNRTEEGCKMVLYDALPTGHLEMPITQKEFNRLYEKYNYFLAEGSTTDRKVFQQDFTDKSNALYYFRKLFADEFSKYFA